MHFINYLDDLQATDKNVRELIIIIKFYFILFYSIQWVCLYLLLKGPGGPRPGDDKILVLRCF